MTNLESERSAQPDDSVNIRLLLEKADASSDGIAELLSALGYRLIPPQEQLLDSDALFQQKDLRERIVRIRKMFAESAAWIHPISNQAFSREACIAVVEVVDERVLRSKWPFEITRYAVKFGFQTSQVLFFFVSPNSRSFVATAYTETLATPALVQVRRLVVDLDNISRTDIDTLSALFYNRMRPDTIIEEFRNALPYLKVGQEFFREYHNLFQLMAKRLKHVFSSEEERYGYAQRVLGRITFLFFLQRKGWLDGDKAYIKKRTGKLDGSQLFDFLYELFDILNTEGNRDRSKGEIPYLNGSLFEREPYPKAKMQKISEACAPLIRDVLRTLDQYNFTISESTPLDKEVAVDPELLGSLFESMLPESERGDKGTFYTHQDEMLFMAREALRAYLSNFAELLTGDQIFHLVHGLNLPAASRLEPKVAREVKDKLKEIRVLDPAVGSGGFLMATLQTLLEARNRANKIIGTVEPDYDAKLEIIEKNLFGVDIEHEAIELARLRLWLTLVVDEFLENIRPLPNLDYNLHSADSLKISEFDKPRQTRIDTDQTVREALLSRIATTREEYSRSHAKDKDEKRLQLHSALRKLMELETGAKPPKVVPFSYRYFFADVMADGGFDVVLMNPPYIQQEDIGKLPGQNPLSYKTEIAADMKLIANHKFSPNMQSDISVYFHIRSLSLLKEDGVAVVIATNKWLDAKYGVPLQDYLLFHSAICCVYDSAYRSFSADVNTVVTVIRKKKKGALNSLVRFVYFRIPFGQVTGELVSDVYKHPNESLLFNDLYRLTTRTQTHLYEDGLVEDETPRMDKLQEASLIEVPTGSVKVGNGKKYVGTKWGNLHLRAPAVFYEVVDKLGTRFKPLGKSYFIMRGTTTGAVDFFILRKIGEDGAKGLARCRNGFGKEFWLEKKFCSEALTDPEDIEGYEISRRRLTTCIFRCRLNRRELRGTKALEYIRWAEESGDAKVRIIRGRNRGRLVRISNLPTVKNRSEWYQLPDINAPRIMLPNIVKNRHVIPLCVDQLYSDDSFIGLYAEQSAEDLWLYLNSAVFRLFMELNGRSEGAGALHMMVYEYKQCPVLDPLPNLSRKFKLLRQFRSRAAHRIVNMAETGLLEFESEDRRELDDLVLEQIGFDDRKERDRILRSIYEWLQERVRERLTKPKTAPESVISSQRIQVHDLREFQ